MTRFPELDHILELHRHMINSIGGSHGIRDMGALESALSQPLMSFGGVDLYPTVVEKAATLGFSIIMNHPFIDGNKRVGHAAMELLLNLNQLTLSGNVDEHERVILGVAAGELDRDEFGQWVEANTIAR